MATISRPLSIFILCLGCVCLQSLDHYQSIFSVKDWNGYNIQIIANHYFESRMCMATISRVLPIVSLCLRCVWLQSSDHYQSLVCV
jgi:hypothetical protein